MASAAASNGSSCRVFVTTTVQLRPARSSPAALNTCISCNNSTVVNAAALGTETCAKIIDGKATAKEIRDEIAAEISKMKESIVGLFLDWLLFLLLLERGRILQLMFATRKKPVNQSYEVHLAKDSSEQEHMNEQAILNVVCIEKDVDDGFSPLNIGRLAMRDREPLFVPCTPKGCIELLHRYKVPIKGKRAVVIGRSNIVGMPAALLLQREDATVSIIHSRTKNPEEITREADIVIVAVGQPNMVRGSWIKPGAVGSIPSRIQAALVDIGSLEMYVMRRHSNASLEYSHRSKESQQSRIE